MTKKRFIKLLMSKGKSRNEARQMASCYNSRNISYARAYSTYRLTIPFIKIACSARQFRESLSKASILMKDFAEGLSK